MIIAGLYFLYLYIIFHYYSYLLFFLDDGVIYTVGSNTFNQLGYQREENLLTPQKVLALEDKIVSSVGCGDTFTVAVTEGILVIIFFLQE